MDVMSSHRDDLVLGAEPSRGLTPSSSGIVTRCYVHTMINWHA